MGSTQDSIIIIFDNSNDTFKADEDDPVNLQVVLNTIEGKIPKQMSEGILKETTISLC